MVIYVLDDETAPIDRIKKMREALLSMSVDLGYSIDDADTLIQQWMITWTQMCLFLSLLEYY